VDNHNVITRQRVIPVVCMYVCVCVCVRVLCHVSVYMCETVSEYVNAYPLANPDSDSDPNAPTLPLALQEGVVMSPDGRKVMRSSSNFRECL